MCRATIEGGRRCPGSHRAYLTPSKLDHLRQRERRNKAAQRAKKNNPDQEVPVSLVFDPTAPVTSTLSEFVAAPPDGAMQWLSATFASPDHALRNPAVEWFEDKFPESNAAAALADEAFVGFLQQMMRPYVARLIRGYSPDEAAARDRVLARAEKAALRKARKDFYGDEDVHSAVVTLQYALQREALFHDRAKENARKSAAARSATARKEQSMKDADTAKSLGLPVGKDAAITSASSANVSRINWLDAHREDYRSDPALMMPDGTLLMRQNGEPPEVGDLIMPCLWQRQRVTHNRRRVVSASPAGVRNGAVYWSLVTRELTAEEVKALREVERENGD